MYVAFKILCIFRIRGLDTNENGCPSDPASQNSSISGSSELCIHNSFKTSGWDGLASQTTTVET